MTKLSLLHQFQIHNLLHSILLVLAMLGLLMIVGYLYAGGLGIIAALSLGISVFALTPKMSPKLILSLYKAQVLPINSAPALYEMLVYLANKAELKEVPVLYYLPSQVPNSFTLGSQSNASIVLSDGLLRTLTGREMLSVLAHEISHLSNNDLWVMNLADVIARVTSVLALFGFLLLLFYLPLFLVSGVSFPWLLILVLLIAPNLSALLQLALSRTREFDADQKAAELTGDPLSLASALNKIEQFESHWLRRVFTPNYKVAQPSLLRTHPSSETRIERLTKLAQEAQFHAPQYEDFQPEIVKYRVVQKPRRRLHGLWY